MSHPPKLLGQVREVLRIKRHRKDMDAPEIETFLTHQLEKNGQIV